MCSSKLFCNIHLFFKIAQLFTFLLEVCSYEKQDVIWRHQNWERKGRFHLCLWIYFDHYWCQCLALLKFHSINLQQVWLLVIQFCWWIRNFKKKKSLTKRVLFEINGKQLQLFAKRVVKFNNIIKIIKAKQSTCLEKLHHYP